VVIAEVIWRYSIEIGVSMGTAAERACAAWTVTAHGRVVVSEHVVKTTVPTTKVTERPEVPFLSCSPSFCWSLRARSRKWLSCLLYTLTRRQTWCPPFKYLDLYIQALVILLQ